MKAVILAGGGGTRLFPLSTNEVPKQFLKLVSDKPMIVDTILRLDGLSRNEDIIVVTNKVYEGKTREILSEYGLSGVKIIAESDRRNTAPAIILSVIYCSEVLGADESEPILVFPSDQAISPVDEFQDAVRSCVTIIADGSIATIGIKATKPDTGYGYIKARQRDGVSKVDVFTEKPDAMTAIKYLESGEYYWNSGIYGFSAKVLKQELAKTYPKLSIMFTKSFNDNLADYSNVDSISIDYAISEKTDNIMVAPFGGKWSDVGSFESLYAFLLKDNNGNAVIGSVEMKNCKTSLIINECASDYKISLEDMNNKIFVISNAGAIIRELRIKNESIAD